MITCNFYDNNNNIVLLDEPSYQTANIIMVFIRSWIPYVRHFVLDQDPEEDIYTAIYLVITKLDLVWSNY